MAKIGCLKPFRGAYNALSNIVLEDGEIAFTTDNKRIYMGNGTDSVSSLIPFINNGSADISSIGDGSITGGISTLNSKITEPYFSSVDDAKTWYMTNTPTTTRFGRLGGSAILMFSPYDTDSSGYGQIIEFSLFDGYYIYKLYNGIWSTILINGKISSTYTDITNVSYPYYPTTDGYVTVVKHNFATNQALGIQSTLRNRLFYSDNNPASGGMTRAYTSKVFKGEGISIVGLDAQEPYSYARFYPLT